MDANANADARRESERLYHNARFGSDHDVRQSVQKWYAALRKGSMTHAALVQKLAADAKVLEYGCADGSYSLNEEQIAQKCREYCGIDISDQAIFRATEQASALSLNNCRFIVMDAENMTFPDQTFDLVYGRGILHHLDIARCYSEIARVLRPGGIATFFEPMGYNPLINGYRSRTPDLRTPDEHPLLEKDLKTAGRFFRKVNVRYFGLSTLLAVPFSGSPLFKPLMSALETADDLFLRLPLVGRNAWHVMLTLEV
jgi:SAM-dependent methyltransferase